MAKIFEGAIKLASTIQQTGAQPLDDRVVVATVADLYDSFGTAIYNGMLVAVADTGNVYMLKDTTKVGSAEGWKLIGGDTAADLTKVKEDVAKNKAAIGVINGTGDGSITKAVADAKTELIGTEGTAGVTIYGAKKAAADAQKSIDDFKGRAEGFATAAQGTLADNAVRAVTEGITNGTISVTTGAGAATDIAVHGLGSAAYTDLTAYATAAQGTKADAADTLSKANKDKIDIINGDASTTGSFAKGDADTLDAAKQYTDDSIAALNVTGNTSEAVKGVTVTVDETNGKVINPVVSIADGTLTGAATDGNLVTGSTVKTYVDDKVSDINTSANALGERVGTLETKVGSKAVEGGAAATGLFKEIADEASTARAAEKKNADAIAAETTRATNAEKKNADAIAAETTRATAAEEKVKSDLLGSATEDYNTLGKLEGKIKAADDKAAAAQNAADSKIKSVTGNNTVIAATADHNVTVSLKTSDKGNVKFTQDTDGLSANVTIPAATVTGVAADDKFLSLTDKLVGANISIAYDAADKKIYLYGKDKTKANAVSSIDCKDFIKDGMLDGSALYKATAATGTVTINGKPYNLTGLTAGHSYIVLVWNTDAAKDAMAIDVTSLVDVYTAGDGLTLTDHKFSVDYTKVAKKSDIADLDVTGNTSAAVAGITITVNQTDGKVITPVVAVTPGAVAEGNTSVVTGGTVKTYVDTAITNAALTWNEITA